MRILERFRGAFVSAPVPTPVQGLVTLMPKLAALRVELMKFERLDNLGYQDIHMINGALDLINLWNHEGGLRDIIYAFASADIDGRYCDIRSELHRLRQNVENTVRHGLSQEAVKAMVEAVTNLQYMSQLDYRKP